MFMSHNSGTPILIQGDRRFLHLHLRLNQTSLLKIQHIPHTVGTVANIPDFVRPVANIPYYVGTLANIPLFYTRYRIFRIMYF